MNLWSQINTIQASILRESIKRARWNVILNNASPNKSNKAPFGPAKSIKREEKK